MSGIIRKMYKTMAGKFFPIIILSIVLLMPKIADSQVKKYAGKKILYVNSYHKGYYWSDGEQEGAEKALAGSGVELKIVYMDTKNNPSEDFSKEAGLKVKNLIDEFKPDVLIVADDNAFKYVVMPYYRDAHLPVVFCGINWDASIYGVPYKNTTGMLEVSLVESTYNHLKKFAKGNRVGFLAFDSSNERKNAEYYPPYFKDGSFSMEFVGDFESWKQKFLEFQNKADILYLASPDGIKNWDMKEAEKFVLENVRIPVGADAAPAILPLVLLGVTKDPQEQGEYAVSTALKILNGEKPSDIPIVKNKKGNLYLNLKIAEKIGAIFTPSMLRNAEEIIIKEK
jgi:ABC-type uncharacterized transport system substrate-binding protein